MVKDKTAALKARLEDELRTSRDDLEQIRRDIEALARDDNQEGGVPTNHMADEGSNVYERERLATIQAEIEERIRLVTAAQERLADGRYGVCERCGKKIAAARLEALPFAQYCIDCQEIVDEEERVTGLKRYQPIQ
jgi:DnaK suppressor protein